MIPRGIIRVSKDPLTLAALDHSKIQTPGISNSSQSKESHYTPGVLMDLILIQQNFFVELTDAQSDLTIVPMQLNFAFKAKTREGHKMKYGTTEEFKLEFESAKVDCFEP
mmetsp:Transcript_13789/g.21542  ORF Transcript_13789/g.21542 Transcript_13789/m.21542 type:complete len:110 (-) Transcript_13789:2221-2550(-)